MLQKRHPLEDRAFSCTICKALTKKDLKIDEFVEITMSSRKTKKQRRIEEVLEMLANSDTLIVTELSRLGRSTAEVITLVNELIARNIRVIVLKQSLDISQHDMHSKVIITLFSLFAELEHDLISSVRTEITESHKDSREWLIPASSRYETA